MKILALLVLAITFTAQNAPQAVQEDSNEVLTTKDPVCVLVTPQERCNATRTLCVPCTPVLPCTKLLAQKKTP